MTIESPLRKELRELADVAPPAGLADRTLAAARHRRHRRWAIGGVGIAAVASVVLATTLVGHDEPKHRSATTPEVIHPAGKGRELVAAYTVAPSRSNGHNDETWVLNPGTGRYVKVSRVAGQRFDDLVISPDGRNALVEVPDPDIVGFVHPPQWGVIPVAALVAGRGDELHRLPPEPPIYHELGAGGPALNDASASWSHDGSKVLLLGSAGDSTYGFAIYDMRSRKLSQIRPLHTLPSDALLCWGRTDSEIALSPRTQSWHRDRSKTIRFFSAKDGHQTGQETLPDALDSSGLANYNAQPISPDGRYAVGDLSGVMDLASHQLRRLPLARHPATTARATISWYGNQHYVVQVNDTTLLLANVKAVPERSMRLPIGTSAMPSGLSGKQIAGLGVQMASVAAYPAGSGVRF